MSHHVYTTPGFVIDSRPNGEAGKLLYIFTRDVGLVLAAAQGIRLGVSKLRYHTQDFSHALFSLVRGKEIWRLTGATSLDAFLPTNATLDPVYFLRARIFAVLRRLLHGEEANEKLFDAIMSFEKWISSAGFLHDDIESVECIMVLRILHILGYAEHGSKGSSQLSIFLGDPSDWSAQLIIEMQAARTAAVKAINSGLKASQL
ncbi:MAG: repair protein RecO, repair protein RecO [Candidatus Taylorbacteria bacterium]|nr:repair protein RecO, repair protein RecO [Candidatus Taylorbacteria bacterium]